MIARSGFTPRAGPDRWISRGSVSNVTSPAGAAESTITLGDLRIEAWEGGRRRCSWRPYSPRAGDVGFDLERSCGRALLPSCSARPSGAEAQRCRPLRLHRRRYPKWSTRNARATCRRRAGVTAVRNTGIAQSISASSRKRNAPTVSPSGAPTGLAAPTARPAPVPANA